MKSFNLTPIKNKNLISNVLQSTFIILNCTLNHMVNYRTKKLVSKQVTLYCFPPFSSIFLIGRHAITFVHFQCINNLNNLTYQFLLVNFYINQISSHYLFHSLALAPCTSHTLVFSSLFFIFAFLSQIIPRCFSMFYFSSSSLFKRCS